MRVPFGDAGWRFSMRLANSCITVRGRPDLCPFGDGDGADEMIACLLGDGS